MTFAVEVHVEKAIRLLLVTWIWGVASYDLYCCQWLMPMDEMNPLARLILVSGGVWLMVAVKVFTMFMMTEWLRYLPLYFTIIIAVVQGVLLLVLTGVIPI